MLGVKKIDVKILHFLKYEKHSYVIDNDGYYNYCYI